MLIMKMIEISNVEAILQCPTQEEMIDLLYAFFLLPQQVPSMGWKLKDVMMKSNRDLFWNDYASMPSLKSISLIYKVIYGGRLVVGWLKGD